MCQTSFRAYLLDPQFVAENRAAIAVPFAAPVFPFFDFTDAREPRMNRISLVPTSRSATATIGLRSMLTRGHAAKLFQLDDELIMSQPADVTLPPVNGYQSPYPGPDGDWGVSGTDDDNNGTVDDFSEALAAGSDDFAASRSTDNNFSWMATIVPKRDRIGNYRDSYTLSIVIFHKRDPSMRAFEDANGNGAYDAGELVYGNERLVNAEFSTEIQAAGGIGQAGGEVLLRARASSGSQIEDLAVREGDWLMLGGSVAAASTDDWVFDFQWYRVTNVDEVDTTGFPGTPPSRLVTLVGPDWRIVSPGQPFQLQATIMPGIVTVYEETLRLELPTGDPQ